VAALQSSLRAAGWAALVFVASCSPSTTDSDTSTSDEPAQIELVPCPDLCTPTVLIAERRYLLTCDVVRPELVEQDVVAVANPEQRLGEARSVIDYPMLRAVESLGDRCDGAGGFIGVFDAEDGRSKEIDAALAHARARCEAFVDTPDDCSRGRAAEARSFADGVHTTVYAYFPEVVSDINQRASSADPHWRVDRQAVLDRWLKQSDVGNLCKKVEKQNWKIDCRLGVRSTDDSVEYLYHVLVKVNRPSEPMFEGSQYEVFLEQLEGGPAWFVTSYQERSLVELYSVIGDTALEAWDTQWDDSFKIISG